MSALEVFSFEGYSVRTELVDGEAWFVAVDVADLLGYSEASAMTRTLDEDEKGLRIVQTLGGSQSVLMVSEAGVYSAALRSRIPGAKAFKRWVTHEVLPSIRRTGSYSVPSFDVASLDGIAALAAAASAAVEEARAARAEVAVLAPKAAQADTFRQSEGLRTIGDLANDLKVHVAANMPGRKVRHQDVFDQAARLGLIIRGDSVRNNQPTARAIDAGWVKPHAHTFDTATRGKQTRVSTRLTPRGYGRLWDGCLQWLGEHEQLAVAA